MSKHTPGPWTADGAQVFTEEVNVAQANGYRVDRETVLANAHLIAAAPDLLEVLKELEESSGYWSEYDVPIGIVDRIRAAIAKATGEQQ